MSYVFVILQYNLGELTLRCIDTLEKTLDLSNCHIVIVDNASTDGSGEFVKSVLKDKNYVKVIINEENLGFARGNNVGYEYAKTLNPDFIVIMNNDVFIHDNDFLIKIEQSFEETQYYVMGPDVVSDRGQTSPLYLDVLSLEEIEGLLEDAKKNLEKSYTKFFIDKQYQKVKNIIKWVAKKLFNYEIRRKRYKKWSGIDRTVSHTGCVLQGACIIFSKKFILNEKKAFNPRTFLYYEETLLTYECNKKNQLVLYNPDLIVYHEESVSTKNIDKSEFKREKFAYKYLAESLEILRDTILGDLKQ